MTNIIPDGESIEKNGKTYISDDGELIEIADSYPDIETALKALQTQ